MKASKIIALALVATFSLQQANAQMFSHHHKTHHDMKKQHKKWKKEQKKKDKEENKPRHNK